MIERTRLSNGLRVVLVPDVPGPRVAVSVHYGVGFRSESPGREGFAHLFEHLMFRGSESLPDGRFYDHVHRFGGTANGTTHQDYTDYYQVVPVSVLERALFSEADRMRAPRFTAEGLAGQLIGVEQEIRQTVTERPYGGFPWPSLPAVLYRTFANAHDGYGDPEWLRQTTLADCEEFFDAHYAPGNAVLTIVGDYSVDETKALVEKHFGDIRARAFAAPSETAEPALAADRLARCTEPGAPAAAVALGYRLPDPAADLPGYLAHLVLASMLDAGGLPSAGLPVINTSCGFFGPLDAKDPDPLIVTAVVPPGVAVEHAVESVKHWWAARAADTGIAAAVDEAVRLLVADHHRRHGDLRTRCRALGRMETLFGAAELVDELPGLLEAVTADQVTAAARTLADAPSAVLVIEPGELRTRPVPVYQAWPASLGVTAPARVRAEARLVPATGRQPVTRLGSSGDVTLSFGPRVFAVYDSRAPLVELRLRLPLRAAGWGRPEQVDVLVQHFAARSGAQARRFGGELTVSSDGQWLDLSGFAPTASVPGWLALATTVLGSPVTTSTVPVHRRLGYERLADEALRAGQLSAGRGDRGLPELQRRIADPTGAMLIAVGDIEPTRLIAAAEHATAGWPTPGFADDPRPAHHGAGRLLVPAAHLPDVHLTLCAAEPAGPVNDPSRYLATAIFGGHTDSRLVTRSLRRVPEGYDLHAGRDVFLDFPRAFVRATVRPELALDVLADIEDEARRMAEEPATAAEVAWAREYTAAQILGAADSPADLADLFRMTVSYGWDPSRVVALPQELAATTVTEVADAGAALFGGLAATTVLAGNVDWLIGHHDLAAAMPVTGVFREM